MAREDLTGQKFGRWTVIKPIKKEKYKYYWLCKCDCGKEKEVLTSSLKTGRSTSCGCYRKEKLHKEKAIDMVGFKIGMLTVIKPLEEHDSCNKLMWECQCDCGNITKFRGEDLRAKKIFSCGCMKSKGEYIIKNILNENNIKYINHKTFSDCKFDDNKNSRGAEFDFYISYNNNFYLIEFDGIQHFECKSEKGWNNEKNLTLTKKHDIIKNEYCKKNNIPLIRIPYWKINTLKLEDLKLETTKYLLKG